MLDKSQKALMDAVLGHSAANDENLEEGTFKYFRHKTKPDYMARRLNEEQVEISKDNGSTWAPAYGDTWKLHESAYAELGEEELTSLNESNAIPADEQEQSAEPQLQVETYGYIYKVGEDEKLLDSESESRRHLYNHFGNLQETCRIVAACHDQALASINGTVNQVLEAVEAIAGSDPRYVAYDDQILVSLPEGRNSRYVAQDVTECLQSRGWNVIKQSSSSITAGRNVMEAMRTNPTLVAESDARKRAFRAGIPYPTAHFLAQSTDAVLQTGIGQGGNKEEQGSAPAPKKDEKTLADVIDAASPDTVNGEGPDAIGESVNESANEAPAPKEVTEVDIKADSIESLSGLSVPEGTYKISSRNVKKSVLRNPKTNKVYLVDNEDLDKIIGECACQHAGADKEDGKKCEKCGNAIEDCKCGGESKNESLQEGKEDNAKDPLKELVKMEEPSVEGLLRKYDYNYEADVVKKLVDAVPTGTYESELRELAKMKYPSVEKLLRKYGYNYEANVVKAVVDSVKLDEGTAEEPIALDEAKKSTAEKCTVCDKKASWDVGGKPYCGEHFALKGEKPSEETKKRNYDQALGESQENLEEAKGEKSSKRKLSYDTWFDKFKPVKNHIDENASYGGTMFETYGEEFDHVEKVAEDNPLKVWTLVDGDKSSYVVQGMQYVNRIGYFITEIPAEKGVDYNDIKAEGSEGSPVLTEAKREAKNKSIKLDYDTWVEKFKPVKNHIDEDASHDGTMYETYGEELEHVEKVAEENPLKVWTLVDASKGTYVLQGMHRVNRVGYFITENPAEEGLEYNEIFAESPISQAALTEWDADDNSALEDEVGGPDKAFALMRLHTRVMDSRSGDRNEAHPRKGKPSPEEQFRKAALAQGYSNKAVDLYLKIQ